MGQLDTKFISGYRDYCRRILSGERPYDVAGELMWWISEYLELVNGAVYIMWGQLTDACEVGDVAATERAETLMKQAAEEFLLLSGDDAELDAYGDRWVELIRTDVVIRRASRRPLA